MTNTSSPLERICRAAREHDNYIVAHPDEFSDDAVAMAHLRIFQRERLNVRDILRYED